MTLGPLTLCAKSYLKWNFLEIKAEKKDRPKCKSETYEWKVEKAEKMSFWEIVRNVKLFFLIKQLRHVHRIIRPIRFIPNLWKYKKIFLPRIFRFSTTFLFSSSSTNNSNYFWEILFKYNLFEVLPYVFGNTRSRFRSLVLVNPKRAALTNYRLPVPNVKNNYET